MINRDQIRAARALLDWSQPQLAERAGVSTDLISKIENGVTDGSLKTINKIISVFTREGVVFTQGGVEKQDLIISKHEDYLEILDDIGNLLEPGEEVLFHRAADSTSRPEIVERLTELREAGIQMRSTICEGDTFIHGNPEDYKWVPKDYFGNGQVITVYRNTVMFHVLDISGNNYYMQVRNRFLSDLYKNEFEYWWRQGTCPEKKK